jgi:hypothetical protein
MVSHHTEYYTQIQEIQNETFYLNNKQQRSLQTMSNTEKTQIKKSNKKKKLLQKKWRDLRMKGTNKHTEA